MQAGSEEQPDEASHTHQQGRRLQHLVPQAAQQCDGERLKPVATSADFSVLQQRQAVAAVAVAEYAEDVRTAEDLLTIKQEFTGSAWHAEVVATEVPWRRRRGQL